MINKPVNLWNEKKIEVGKKAKTNFGFPYIICLFKVGIINSCFRERSLREQQEMNRKVKERSERERQRAEQEKRKEQEEELALEQVEVWI